MTVREFVKTLWENDPYGDYSKKMDIETAKTDLENFAADGWELPEGITPEEYMDAWNELVEETDLVELDGNVIHMETAAELMDDEIREQLHAEGIHDPQTFLDRYCEEHYAKYGESFTV